MSIPGPSACSIGCCHCSLPVLSSYDSIMGLAASLSSRTRLGSDHSTSEIPGSFHRVFPVDGSSTTMRALARAVCSDRQTYGPHRCGPNVEWTGLLHFCAPECES